MKILFATNNLITQPVIEWLEENGHAVIRSEHLTLEQVKEADAQLLISYCYNKIIPKEFLEEMGWNAINLHISYLPWNKGASPNFWSFVEDTPKGVTIHYIDESLDTGKIITQTLVDVSTESTFAETYVQLHSALQNLFYAAFRQFAYWRILAREQCGKSSYHFKRDLANLVGENFDWNTKISTYLANRKTNSDSNEI